MKRWAAAALVILLGVFPGSGLAGVHKSEAQVYTQASAQADVSETVVSGTIVSGTFQCYSAAP